MDKKSSAERVQEKVEKDMQRLIDKIHKNYKGITPFKREKIDPLEVIYHIKQSGYLEDPSELIQEFGYEVVNKFFSDYLKMRGRYNA